MIEWCKHARLHLPCAGIFAPKIYIEHHRTRPTQPNAARRLQPRSNEATTTPKWSQQTSTQAGSTPAGGGSPSIKVDRVGTPTTIICKRNLLTNGLEKTSAKAGADANVLQ